MCSAAITLQSGWRAALARGELAQQRAAATVLQAAFRGYMVRCLIAQSAMFAVFLQSSFRGARARRAFLRLRRAAVVIQAAVRGQQARRRCGGAGAEGRGSVACAGSRSGRTHCMTALSPPPFHRLICSLCLCRLQEQRSAVLILQGAWRAQQARAQLLALQQHAAAQHCAATTIQSAWRAKQAHARYRHHRAAVVAVQACWRGWRARDALQQQREAALAVQSAWRGYIVRAELALQAWAATTLQAAWRGRQQQLAYGQLQWAAVVVQAAVRCHLAAARYQEQRSAATELQSCWRARQARLLLCQHKAAASIQACWRGYAVRLQLAHEAAAAVAVQAAWRAWAQRQRYLQARGALVRLQTAVRRWQAQCAYAQLRGAAVTLQSSWRAAAARRALAQHQAAATIQAHMRGLAVRRELARQYAAVIILQAGWRCHAQRSSYCQQRAAAVLIQSHVRGWQAQSSYQVSNLLQRFELQRHSGTHGGIVHVAMCVACSACGWQLTVHFCRPPLSSAAQAQQRAAITIQRVARGAAVRRQLAHEAAAATAVQAAWRMHVQRCQYQHTVAAATRLQATARMLPLRRALQEHREAALVLQCAERARQARVQLEQVRAAVALQAAVRGQQARKALSRQLAAVATIQRYARGLLARRQVRIMADYMRSMAEFQKARAPALRDYVAGGVGCMHVDMGRERTMPSSALPSAERKCLEQTCPEPYQPASIVHSSPLRRCSLSCTGAPRLPLTSRPCGAAMWRAKHLPLCGRRTSRPSGSRPQRSPSSGCVHWGQHAQRWGSAAAGAGCQPSKLFIGCKSGSLAAGSLLSSPLLFLQEWRRTQLLAQVHARQGALAVIARYLPMMRQRLALLRLRSAAVVVQRSWREQLERRHAAATALQAAVRGWLLRRRTRAMVQGVVRLQVRGCLAVLLLVLAASLHRARQSGQGHAVCARMLIHSPIPHRAGTVARPLRAPRERAQQPRGARQDRSGHRGGKQAAAPPAGRARSASAHGARVEQAVLAGV